MSIPLQCPGCGKRYRFDDRMAGREARCPCGQTMKVPGSASKTAPTSETSVAPRGNGPPDAGPQAAGSVAADREVLETTVSDLAAADRGDKPPEKLNWRDLTPRIVVGILSIVYGAVAVLIVPLGLFDASGMIGLLQPVAAVLIVVGGVLILRGHEHGRAIAGLSCAILCFFPLVSAVYSALQLMNAVRPGALFVLLLRTVLLYAIPVLIVVWTIREETRKEAESSRPD
ncbi:MAG TPA: hypothetical protein VMY37_19435 [Thermoguttaceae bacterium]|nr:hypothetical protein [Thermoguttaceae bacterium]